jgi:hypothetical protein
MKEFTGGDLLGVVLTAALLLYLAVRITEEGTLRRIYESRSHDQELILQGAREFRR